MNSSVSPASDHGAVLVVSLHDVSPLTREPFTRMIDELRAVGVGRCSLLVIPNHHHRGHFLADAGFCRWLEKLASEGHELVVHGYYHQRPRQRGETFLQRLTTQVYTMGEGEFYDLPKSQAAEMLDRTREEFRQLDAPFPKGFIAPAWLLGAEAAEAVREAGFDYTTRLRGIEDCVSGENTASQSLVYSCRNAWRRMASMAWNASLARRLRQNSLVRLSLHVPDFRHPRIWRQVLRLATEAAQTRRVGTYADFVTERRLATARR